MSVGHCSWRGKDRALLIINKLCMAWAEGSFLTTDLENVGIAPPRRLRTPSQPTSLTACETKDTLFARDYKSVLLSKVGDTLQNGLRYQRCLQYALLDGFPYGTCRLWGPFCSWWVHMSLAPFGCFWVCLLWTSVWRSLACWCLVRTIFSTINSISWWDRLGSESQIERTMNQKPGFPMKAPGLL